MADSTDRLSPERLAEIRADLDAVPAPPWRWIGTRDGGGPELVTDHSGRQYLLRADKPADRNGDELLDPFDDAPVYGDLQFRDKRDGERYSTMRTGSELGVGRTSYNPDTLVDVANPIARWIKQSPAHAAALLAEVDRLRELLVNTAQNAASFCRTGAEQLPNGDHHEAFLWAVRLFDEIAQREQQAVAR